MRILFWLPGGFWDQAIGGVESLARTLAQELKNCGHEIYVISFESESHEVSQVEKIDGIFLLRCSHAQLSKNEQLQTLKNLHVFIKKIQPDLFHLHYTANANLLYYFFLEKNLNCPQVMTTHGLLCKEHFAVYQKIASKMSHVFAVSNYLSNIAQELLSKPCITIYNGMDCPQIPYLPPSSFDQIRFLCLGRFTSEKAYDIAIEAFKKVLIKYPDACLELVGEGIEKKHLQELASKHPQIIFSGKLDHQAALAKIQNVHVVVIPSRYESFGLVAIEAGMMGRAVIAANVGGLAEIINEDGGILVEACNADTLMQAMLEMLENTDQIEKRGRFAYQWTRQYFSSSAMCEHYLKYYALLWRQTYGTNWQLLAQQRTAFTLESSTC